MAVDIPTLFRKHHEAIFRAHGATAEGVQWGPADQLRFRYAKMLKVLNHDFARPDRPPRVLDVGCGWGGLCALAQEDGLDIEYTGIDLVGDMIDYGRAAFPEATFVVGDVLEFGSPRDFDYVVCNGVMTQKLTATLGEMETFADRIIHKLYDLAQYGCAFNLLSTRVNFMAENLYYVSPGDMLMKCLREVSPRVRLDHAYSSLGSGRFSFYDYTVFIYRDQPDDATVLR